MTQRRVLNWLPLPVCDEVQICTPTSPIRNIRADGHGKTSQTRKAFHIGHNRGTRQIETEFCKACAIYAVQPQLFPPAGIEFALSEAAMEGHEMTERRSAQRYESSLPILICTSAQRTHKFHTGQMRDISSTGVYFRLDQQIDLGASIEMTISLPVELTGGLKVLVRASGKVVRMDPSESPTSSVVGVAAVIEHFDIIRPRASAAA